MRRLVRYTLSPDCPSTASDHQPRCQARRIESNSGKCPVAAALFADQDRLHRAELRRSREGTRQRRPGRTADLSEAAVLARSAHGDAIVYPAISQNVHFEGELGWLSANAPVISRARKRFRLRRRIHVSERRYGSRHPTKRRPVHARQRVRHVLRGWTVFGPARAEVNLSKLARHHPAGR